MKIAMIGHKRIPSREGGIEIVVGELSKRMAALGHNVTAYNRKSRHIAGDNFDTAQGKTDYCGAALKWVYTPDSSKLNAIVYSTLATLSAATKPFDVIHYHAEGPCALIPLAKLFGKRCVATIHGLDWQRSKWGGFATAFLKFGEKCAAKYADEVIVLSENVRNYFKETYNRETVFIPNGIERPETAEPEIIRDKYALEKDGYILFLGRLVPEKGIHYLINAYKKSKIDIPLVIAGGASHTAEYEVSLREAADKSDNIIFTGFVQGKELQELYSNAYLYVLPSDVEGMPISLLEAMSYGNACLTSDIPECTEVCGEAAAYFEKSNEESLEKALVELTKSREKTEQLKSSAAEYVLKRYSWDEVVEKTLALYRGNNN